MKIAKIKDIEELLNIKLTKNKLSLGSDTSVHSTGIAILSTDNEFIYLDYTKNLTTPKNKSVVDCQYIFKTELQEVREALIHLISNLSIESKSLVIEGTFYQRNPQVLIKLSRFGGIVFCVLEHLFDDCEYPSPTRARSGVSFKKSSKEDIKSSIIKFVNLLGFKVEQEDIADAIVLALYGLTVHIKGKYCCICGGKKGVTRNRKKKKYYCSKCTYQLKKGKRVK